MLSYITLLIFAYTLSHYLYIFQASTYLVTTVTSMLNKLHGQPESYDKKCVSSLFIAQLDGAILAPAARRTKAENDRCRSKYRFGKTLGAGTYGIVREADSPDGKCAVKIILKKNVKGNDQMVYDELDMLQRLKHPHIVRFIDWFESRVRSPVQSTAGQGMAD